MHVACRVFAPPNEVYLSSDWTPAGDARDAPAARSGPLPSLGRLGRTRRATGRGGAGVRRLRVRRCGGPVCRVACGVWRDSVMCVPSSIKYIILVCVRGSNNYRMCSVVDSVMLYLAASCRIMSCHEQS